MSSENPEARGRRLANEGRVKHDEQAQVYYVQSDSGETYTIVVSGTGHPSCTCPSSGHCSHMYAVAHSRPYEAVPR